MKTKTVHRCTECDGETPRWLGRCPACEAWGTLVEDAYSSRPALTVLSGVASRPVPIVQVDTRTSAPRPTGVGELDRVLDGGLVPGSVTLLAGESGMEKLSLIHI